MNTSRIVRQMLLATLPWLPPAASAVAPVDFQVRNNADLVALCTTPPTDSNHVAAIHFCHGVGVGFMRYYEALSEGKEFEHLFCLPKTATRNEVVAQYVGYSKAHPDYDREAVGNVLLKFLIETFPCAPGPTAPKR